MEEIKAALKRADRKSRKVSELWQFSLNVFLNSQAQARTLTESRDVIERRLNEITESRGQEE